jgi:hypothetical protein
VIRAGLLNDLADPGTVRYLTRRSLVTPVSFLLSIPLAFASVRLAQALWFAPFALIAVINIRQDRS